MVPLWVEEHTVCLQYEALLVCKISKPFILASFCKCRIWIYKHTIINLCVTEMAVCIVHIVLGHCLNSNTVNMQHQCWNMNVLWMYWSMKGISACIVSISNIRLGFSTYSAGQHCIVYTVYNLRHFLLDILCLHFCALDGANYFISRKKQTSFKWFCCWSFTEKTDPSAVT